MPSRHLKSANEMIADNPDSPVLVKTIDMQKGYVDSLHQHQWHQVIFPLKGLLQTQADRYQHLVPHTSALFVPANLSHESVALSNTTFIGIYINPKLGRPYEREIRTISLTPFIRELLKEIHRSSQQSGNRDSLSRLLDVLHDQIAKDDLLTFKLLLPEDRRLKLIFETLTDTPGLDWSLLKWGECVGASERTLSRLFAKEFNTSFSLWRRHLRLIYSLSLLDENLSIQTIADKVGYQNDSSYIKAFKESFGTTPQQFRTKL
ncbi:AraC family transcriptional regulator [Photobacterium kasasachensis]|uniref:AraC family transcriptional regulator n=1 Tax=Photobacterium kasasachensis TaxID=2910240 RepID=UPI003D0CA654